MLSASSRTNESNLLYEPIDPSIHRSIALASANPLLYERGRRISANSIPPRRTYTKNTREKRERQRETPCSCLLLLTLLFANGTTVRCLYGRIRWMWIHVHLGMEYT